MNEPTVINELDEELDIFGQQPGLKIYTQICCCFPVIDASSHSAIINTLRDGLERLSASFPWIAGQIVVEGSAEGDSGIFKIKPLEKTPRLVVKDLRHDSSMPTMDALRQANFPFSMLDENFIAPCNTLPSSDRSGSDNSASDALPVFLVQATFITGGLLLTFVGQHNAMDMIGQGHIIRLLSKACHGEQFAREELTSGNLSRCNLIPLFEGPYTLDPELARQILEPAPSPLPTSNSPNPHSTTVPPTLPPPPPPPPQCSWAYFTFSPPSLSALKSLATSTIPPSGSSFVSTDDVLSAFIWQSITRARLSRLTLNSSSTNHPTSPPKSQSTFARAINVRSYLGIPPLYTGLVQNMTHHTLPLQTLITSPLGEIASQLRQALGPTTSNLESNTRALATCLSRSRDKTPFSIVASIEPETDIMLSSWAKVDLYSLDFGLVRFGFGLGMGKPEAVRRPRFEPCEGLVYLMPRRGDGEMVAGMCLREEDMEFLKGEGGFGRFGVYIG